MQIVFLIIIGAAAGFIATRVMRVNLGLPQTIAIGVIGALIGGMVLRVLLATLGFAAGFVGALLGAIILLWAWKTFLRGR